MILTNLEHEDYIQQVRFNNDGSRFATADSKGTVHLWSHPEGELLFTFRDHRQSIAGLAFSPAAPMLATASHDSLIVVRDLSSPLSESQPMRLQGHGYIVNDLAFSKDGMSLLSVSRDKTLRLWESASGKMIRILHGASSPLLSLALNPENSLIALGELESEILLLSFPKDLPQLKRIGSKNQEEGAQDAIDSNVSASKELEFYPAKGELYNTDLAESGEPIRPRKEAQAYLSTQEKMIPARFAAVSYTHLTLPTNREV